ncbi:MAG: hypothetical protein JO307_12215 [Bryobacterales bacterium]|nr:hypothetical protein [Bryobacterales bacterium]MBV9399595.1 hypothetical protein [Bryobacterales bacterium]
MRFAALVCLIAAPVFAGTWSGVLVNSKCYDDLERSVGPWESGVDANRDRNYEIRYCRANARTTEFTVVQPDGRSYRLDATGAAQAAEIVRNGNPKWMFVVAVSGKLTDDTIAVDSVSMLRNVRP